MTRGNQQLSIDKDLFLIAFGRDVDYEAMGSDLSFLDRQTGEIVWIFETDYEAEAWVGIPAEENRQDRERIEADPDQFIEIPGLGHGDHHDILRAFIQSAWCGDERRQLNAEEAYSGSIGRWKRSVRDEEAVHAYYEFRDTTLAKLAEEWLGDHGIAPIWR